MATPLCPYFGKCGGCSAQHIDYSLQVENKRKVVSRVTGVEDVKVFTGKEYFYRNRMDMIFTPRGVGFRQKDKWYAIVDIEQCKIADERINSFIKEIREYFADCDYYDIVKQTGTFKQVVIRTPQHDSSLSFVLNEGSTRLGEAVEKIKEYAKVSTAKNVIVTYAPPKSEASISENFFVVKGKDKLTETFLEKSFSYSVQGFFQNNSEMAEKMLDYVNGILKRYPTQDAHLLDLYGGVGTFGIVNCDLFREVTTVESFKPTVDAATENISINNTKNAKALALDATHLRRLKLPSNLYVITDPPRTGMNHKTIVQLNEFKPKVIIYVSCNPQQLDKEIPKFKHYETKSAAMFDLFPQTPHMEAVVELVKKEF